nr:hypothetical protein [Tanacetum cinerariifolium]
YFKGLRLASGKDDALVAANGWISFMKKTLRDIVDSKVYSKYMFILLVDRKKGFRLRFVLDCILSWTAFCQALRFAYLKTICCVLLRTNSAKLKTTLRFVSGCVLPKKIAFCLRRLRFEEPCVLP